MNSLTGNYGLKHASKSCLVSSGTVLQNIGADLEDNVLWQGAKLENIVLLAVGHAWRRTSCCGNGEGLENNVLLCQLVGQVWRTISLSSGAGSENRTTCLVGSGPGHEIRTMSRQH